MNPKPTKTFVCCNQPFNTDALKAHMLAKHGVSETELKTAKGKAVSFLDGKGGWYQQEYECECKGVKFSMTVEGKTR